MAKAEMHSLRPYQIEAIASVEREWEAGKRATCVVLATGLGKTTVFAEIVRRMHARTGGRALVLAHRIELVQQAAERIGSLGLACEIESGDVRASPLGSLFGSVAVVATVQTLRGRRLRRWDRDAFPLIVIDEAHHATAKQYREILDHFASARVLGVTATPDRGDGVAIGEVFESTAASMTILDGVRGGYLCDVGAKLVDLDCVSLEKVRITKQGHGRDLAAEDIAKAMEGLEPMHAIAAPLAREAGARPTLVFMPSVETAHMLAEVLSGYVGAERVRSLDGQSDPDVRASVLEDFRAGRVQFLINCQLFTEGFDAPATACVAIARPTRSRALYAQMVGRGTRMHPSKSDLLVLDFYPRNTKHDLAKVIDIFDGDEMPDSERAMVAEEMAAGAGAREAREKAKARALEREERLAAQRERARVSAEARYAARERDLWGGQWTTDRVLGVTPDLYASTIPRLLDQQRARMEALRIEIDARETVASASKKIQETLRRRRDGLCTVKQARVLARAGLRDDLTFDQARAAMDLLVANRWKASPDLLARYGRP